MLRNYEAFLGSKGNLKTQYIPYYLKWVSDCYVFLNEPLSNRLNSDQKKQFLSDMAKRYEDWQVKQADTALRLYDYFLSKNITPTMAETSSHNETWKLLEEKMRNALRLRHRSFSTEKTYLIWLRSFRAFVTEKQPDQLGGRDLQDFLSHLAVERKVSSSTQNQALNAIVFFYRHVLDKNIDQELSAVRAKQRRHLPVVLTIKEIQNIFDQLSETSKRMAMVIYGGGLRLQECLQLR
ncbi:MAG: integron integrase, partial [Deltaproteobacteria bacterium]|nr:integron integrase [Deltaproteobacteria bacterium]